MERVTMRLPAQQLAELEALVEAGEYPNRSEAVRAAIRDKLREQRDRVGIRAREVAD